MCARKKSIKKSPKLDQTNWVYDPVKYEVGGEAAEKVVWSTKSLQMAVDALNQGLPLKSNPFCGRDTQLLKPELLYRRTKEEVEDYIKCMQDPVYFASKCFLMTPQGLQPCVLRDYQVDYLNLLKNNNYSIWLAARQVGKTLSLLTRVNIYLHKNYLKNVKIPSYLSTTKQNNFIYINDIPLFEIFNWFFTKNLKWKIKYRLYKFMYYLEYGWQKRNENKKET